MADDHSERLRSHLSDAVVDRGQLRKLLDDYRLAIEKDAMNNEFLDLKMATTLINKFEILLMDTENAEDLKLVAGGIAYLLDDADEIPDHEIAGFDDDAEIFNEVAQLCGRADLLVEI